MTAVNAVVATPPPARLTPRTVIAAWRSITRKELGTTFLLGCLLVLYQIVVGVLPTDQGFRLYLVAFIHDELQVFGFLLAVVVADRVTGKDPDRRGVYLLAVVMGAAVGDAVMWVTAITLSYAGSPDAYANFPPMRIVLFINLEVLVLGVATVWIVNDRRRAARARARMHSAELERTDAAKRTIESELQAMQARVEPQFLFNTLAQVRRLYEQDPTLGERMLDELITYLRAAMPKMRDTSSTVGQEIELVRAYLGIVQLRFGERLAFEIETADPRTADARMPPMMLLPLIDAIVHGLESSTIAASIRIEIEAIGRRLRLTIASGGSQLGPEAGGDGIASIRERLSAVYGSNARLVLEQREEGVTAAIFEFPFESAARREPPSSTDGLSPPSDHEISGAAA